MGTKPHPPLCPRGLSPARSWAGSVSPPRHRDRPAVLWLNPRNTQKSGLLEILGGQMAAPWFKAGAEGRACVPPSRPWWPVALAWCRSPAAPSNPALLLHAAGDALTVGDGALAGRGHPTGPLCWSPVLGTGPAGHPRWAGTSQGHSTVVTPGAVTWHPGDRGGPSPPASGGAGVSLLAPGTGQEGRGTRRGSHPLSPSAGVPGAAREPRFSLLSCRL